MPDATTVFLVRHAAHDRLGRVLAGRMAGVVLSPEGRAEAARAAARLGREALAAVYSSPLERALETAEPIAARQGLAVEIEPNLQEVDFGDWTGQRFDALERDPGWRLWNEERAGACPPGGEGMVAAQARLASALDGWRSRHPGLAVAAVSHAEAIRALVCRILGLSLDRWHAFEIAPASITTLVAWEGGGKLLGLNETVPAAIAA